MRWLPRIPAIVGSPERVKITCSNKCWHHTIMIIRIYFFLSNYSCLHLLRQFLQKSCSSLIDSQKLLLCQLIYNIFELSTIDFDIIVFCMLLILESIQKDLWIELLIEILFLKSCAELVLQICSIFLHKVFLCSHMTAFFVLTIIWKHLNQILISHFMMLF